MMARNRGFLGRILHVAIELPPDDDAILVFDLDFGSCLRPVQMPDGQHSSAPPDAPAAIIGYRRGSGNRSADRTRSEQGGASTGRGQSPNGQVSYSPSCGSAAR